MPRDTISITKAGDTIERIVRELVITSQDDPENPGDVIRNARVLVAEIDALTGEEVRLDYSFSSSDLLSANPGQGAQITAAYNTLRGALQAAAQARLGD